MPRKGVPKVRTGCLTCKKRKVKCDEIHPSCQRCTSTGRTCDGYMPPPPGWMSWDRLLSPPVPSSPSSLPNTDALELRSLAFYQQIVAPTLCGPLDSSFWTRLVSQMTHSEPATRHAVLAISSLYEHFDNGDGYCVPRRANDFAIQHYNAAIQLLIGPHTSKRSPADLNTVLLVCILFTCIEFLRGDPESAISHSQHGISLLNSGKDIKPELVRVFRHLSIFPYFFGGQISTFPVLGNAHLLLNGVFKTPEEALESLDWLLARAVRLVRASDYHRLGYGEEMQPLDAILLEQTQLEADLDLWWATFSRLRRDTSDTAAQDTMTLLILEMRWLVCSIWADTCLSPHEMVYDNHVDKFQRIIAMATQAQSLLKRCRASSSIHHKFMFVMGFCPLLYFVVTKCRFFKLRLRALSLLRTLSYMRETLWDASTLYAVGKRIVEMEHNIHYLTSEDVDAGGCRLEGMGLPRDELRVRDSALEADLDIREVHGRLETRRRISFLVWGSKGIERLHDWLM